MADTNTKPAPRPGTYEHDATRERAEMLARRDVELCVSHLVYECAQRWEGWPLGLDEDELMDLCRRTRWVCETCGEDHDDEDEAAECCPGLHCLACGETFEPSEFPADDSGDKPYPSACPSCRSAEIVETGGEVDEHEDEAYEHWAVSRWFAEQLSAQGEIVSDTSIGWVWGRCTTGQDIAMDAVVLRIAHLTGGVE